MRRSAATRTSSRFLHDALHDTQRNMVGAMPIKLQAGRVLQMHRNPCAASEFWCSMRNSCEGTSGMGPGQDCGNCFCSSTGDYCDGDPSACITCSEEWMQQLGAECVKSCESVGPHDGSAALDPCNFLDGCERIPNVNPNKCVPRNRFNMLNVVAGVGFSILLSCAVLVARWALRRRRQRTRAPQAPLPNARQELAMVRQDQKQVLVPPGTIAGQSLDVVAPNGQALQVAVPPGVAPGSTFAVTLPPTEPRAVVALPAQPAVAVGVAVGLPVEAPGGGCA